jgi:hypothetical protein
VLDFEWGLSFEQLRRVLPLLHVALSAAANAPNNAATWAILYDEMRALLSDELWPGRDSDKPPVHARAEVVDRARRDYKTHVASLFAMFYEDPVAAFLTWLPTSWRTRGTAMLLLHLAMSHSPILNNSLSPSSLTELNNS